MSGGLYSGRSGGVLCCSKGTGGGLYTVGERKYEMERRTKVTKVIEGEGKDGEGIE
jgi:hypothetical protein